MLPASPALADSSDLSAYVRARAADADGQSDRAAAGYAIALAAAPGDAVVAMRAYREGFRSGDLALARRASLVLKAAGVAPADVALLDLADAIRAKDVRAANAAVDRVAGSPFDFLAPVMRAWIAFGAGDKNAAAPLANLTGNPLAVRYARENRALILLAAGRSDEGLDAVRVLFGSGMGSLDLRLTAAELLVRGGKKAEAASLLSGDDPTLAALRANPLKAPKPDAAFGISRLLTRLSADLAQADPTPLSVVLARLSILLEPGNARARLQLADLLAKDGAIARAFETLGQIPAKSPYSAAARIAWIAALDGAGDSAQALAAAKSLAENGDVEDLRRYADLLLQAKRFDDAAATYAEAITRAGPSANWTLYLQRGGALDRAGKWAEAEPMLEKAVELAPDQPIALNYLGYARIERGEDLPEAQAMLEKAATLSPGEPSIADSLAWAYFVRGAPAKALPLLEAAAQKSPANATINEHLGDTYWALGRRYEARYAWRAAAIYADATEAARLSAKLVDGPKPRVAHD